MVWYSHLFQNFPQFIVIHIVKGFGIVNKAEIDVFLEPSCFFHDPADVGNLISGSSAFSKTSLNFSLGEYQLNFYFNSFCIAQSFPFPLYNYSFLSLSLSILFTLQGSYHAQSAVKEGDARLHLIERGVSP